MSMPSCIRQTRPILWRTILAGITLRSAGSFWIGWEANMSLARCMVILMDPHKVLAGIGVLTPFRLKALLDGPVRTPVMVVICRL